MFGHLPELVIILVVALIVFGPEKLPEVAGTIGRTVRDIRGAMDEAMHPEEEPVDFDAYYREFEATHGTPGEPEIAEVWPGVGGAEGVEMALDEHQFENVAAESADVPSAAAIPLKPNPPHDTPDSA